MLKLTETIDILQEKYEVKIDLSLEKVKEIWNAKFRISHKGKSGVFGVNIDTTTDNKIYIELEKLAVEVTNGTEDPNN